MPIYQQILKDERLDKQLWEKGYVIIPFLSDEEVNELIQFFWDNHENLEQPMYATAHVLDTAFRQKMNDGVKQVFNRAINEHFTNVKPLGASFIVKGKGKEGVLDPHMDWNIVNEEQSRSFNIWVPLVDVDENNGALMVLPESHNKVEVFRGANIENPFKAAYQILWEEMNVMNMKAGYAFIYDHRLIHASKENNTEKHRLSIAYGIIQENEQMYYYYKNGNKIEEYVCPPDFYMNENPGEGPTGLKINRSINYDFPVYNEQQFANQFGIKLKKPFLERIRTFFS